MHLSCSRRLIFVAWLAAAGCGHKPTANLPTTPVVRVVPVTEEKVVDFELFTGRTEATESVEVRARVTGYLVEIGFEPGDDVVVNQMLFRIDPRPYKAVLDQADSQVALARARLKLAQADNARAIEINKTPGAISKQDLDRFASALSEGQAALDAALAQQEQAHLNWQFTEVKAPIAGRASRNLLTIGNLVTQDSTLLTTIVAEDPMFAYFDVDERTMLRVQKMIREGKFKGVREGGKLDAYFGLANEQDAYPHKGVLDFVDNRVDPSTGTLQVRAVIDNPAPEPTKEAAPPPAPPPPASEPLPPGPRSKGDKTKLRDHLNRKPRAFTAGLFLRVRLPIGDAHPALLVPQAAIRADQGQKYVLVVTAEKKVERRPVDAGAVQPDGRQVVAAVSVVATETGFRAAREGESGEPSLKPGELVIVAGLQRVVPGATVETKPLAASDVPN